MREVGRWHLKTDFHDNLREFVEHPLPLNVLVEGPAGCGKTTLVRNTLFELNLSVFNISPDILSCDSAEEVEEGLITVFSDAEYNAPSAIFLDDLDHWLPKSISNPAQFHLLAHLQELLFDLREPDAPPVAFIATAQLRSQIHPAFSAFAEHPAYSLNIIRVHPLSEGERADIFRSTIIDVTNDEVDALVVRTPGYVAVDMARLLLEARHSARSESKVPLVDIRDAISRVRPLLLDVHGKRWSFSSSGPVLTSPSSSLYGLEYAEETIQAALSAAFSRVPNRALSEMGHVRGLLVHGKSGSGKSALLARAARSLPRGTVHILRVDSVDIVSAVIGESERALTQLFAAARAAAPTLLLLENLHILAPSRDHLQADRADGASSTAAFERILATLLVEMDGVRQDTKPVMMIASTPDITLVEAAMLRPGRFEIHIETSLPGEEVRRKLFAAAVEKVMPNGGADIFRDLTLLDDFMQLSEGWTAPDISSLINETAFRILREDGKSTRPAEWKEALNEPRFKEELKKYLDLRLASTVS